MSGWLSSIGSMITQLSATPARQPAIGTGVVQEELGSLRSFYQGYKECMSNHEIYTFVTNHIKYLKWQLSSSQATDSQICAILERCLICKALGHDVSFAGIYAIQLAQSSQQWSHKRITYLVCAELLNDNSEMSILMVSTLQRDLRGHHVPSICIALSVTAQIISSELIPSLDAIVCERLKHPTALVRRHALLCMGSFLRKQTELIPSKLSSLRVSRPDFSFLDHNQYCQTWITLGIC